MHNNTHPKADSQCNFRIRHLMNVCAHENTNLNKQFKQTAQCKTPNQD